MCPNYKILTTKYLYTSFSLLFKLQSSWCHFFSVSDAILQSWRTVSFKLTYTYRVLYGIFSTFVIIHKNYLFVKVFSPFIFFFFLSDFQSGSIQYNILPCTSYFHNSAIDLSPDNCNWSKQYGARKKLIFSLQSSQMPWLLKIQHLLYMMLGTQNDKGSYTMCTTL